MTKDTPASSMLPHLTIGEVMMNDIIKLPIDTGKDLGSYACRVSWDEKQGKVIYEPIDLSDIYLE